MVASIAHNFKCDRYYANLINNIFTEVGDAPSV